MSPAVPSVIIENCDRQRGTLVFETDAWGALAKRNLDGLELQKKLFGEIERALRDLRPRATDSSRPATPKRSQCNCRSVIDIPEGMLAPEQIAFLTLRYTPVGHNYVALQPPHSSRKHEHEQA